jgi:acetyl esterase/lipase
MTRLLAIAGLVFAVSAQAQEPGGPPEALVKPRVVLSLPGMDRVRVRRDLTYTSGDASLKMDVYLPEAAAPKAGWPVVVLVHGGPVPSAWAPKNWGVFRSYGELIAASGLAAVTFNHRLDQPSDYPRAAGDVAALLAHVRKESRTLEVDAERVAVWAFSGGGPLLGSVLAERGPYLRCAVAYYAFLGAPSGTPPEPRLSAVEQLRRATGPLPPLLVARAGRDGTALNATIDELVRAALEKNATLDLLTHPTGRHGFDILDDDARSREVIRRTLAFLKDGLAAP